MQDPSPPPFSAVAPPLPPPFPEQEKLRCPRCDSTNTKFCYYNNYNLSQPRHFCKSCRRYWTKGGSLRNIPVGGGSRKNSKRSSATTATKRASGAAEKPEPEPVSGLGSHELGFSAPMDGFSSMLVAGDGNGPSGVGGVVENGGGSRMGCWGGGGSNIGWTDLAIFTPTSRFDSSESTCSQISYRHIV